MGAPDQVFKFGNFLDCLIGSIRGNTIAAIGTINPGSLCIQYLYAPQIHYDLSGKPIAFTGNLSSKEGKFSLIKTNVTSTCLYFLLSRIRPVDLLSATEWADFTDPIIGTLIPNFSLTYLRQQLA